MLVINFCTVCVTLVRCLIP